MAEEFTSDPGVMPYNTMAEQSVLGAILLESSMLDEVLDFIKNEMMPRDPQTLRNYLLNGTEGLKAEQSAYDAVGDAIKDKVKEALSDIEVKHND